MEEQDIRFESEEEAIEYCEQIGADFVFRSDDPNHADAPFFVLKYEWIGDMMIVNDTLLH